MGISSEDLSKELVNNGIKEICCHLIQTCSVKQLIKLLPFVLFSLHLIFIHTSSLLENETSILDFLYETVIGKNLASLSPISEDLQLCLDILFHWMHGVSVRS